MTMQVWTRRDWEHDQHLCHGLVEAKEPHQHTCIPASEAIKSSVQWLIDRLYCPDDEFGAVMRSDYLKKLATPGERREWLRVARAIANEPINWGDLNVVEVRSDGSSWVVRIEEADPAKCPEFVSYITTWLERWGWSPVRVELSW